MKVLAKRSKILCAFMMMGSLAVAASLLGATCTTNLAAGDDIQAAIDAASPGDVLCLAAGLYEPASKIDVHTSVTLQGPQWGVDPRPSAGTSRVPGDTATEAVVDGSTHGLSGIFVISASQVVFDGFEVRGGSGDLIDSDDPTTGTTLRYLVIRDATGDEGIQLRDCTDCLVEYNHVFDIAQDGINMCCGSLRGMIRHNEVHDSASINAAIYIYDALEIHVVRNLVYNTTDNDGIKMGGGGCRGSKAPDGVIADNVVHDTIQDGITVYSSGTLVENNEIYASTSENGALYISCDGTEDVVVRGNAIHDNGPSVLGPGFPTYGVRIGKGSHLPATDTLAINANCIESNPEGLRNFAAPLLDAEGNWWGDPSGPSGDGPGTGDSVAGNVDFDPWLTEEPFCGPRFETLEECLETRIEEECAGLRGRARANCVREQIGLCHGLFEVPSVHAD